MNCKQYTKNGIEFIPSRIVIKLEAYKIIFTENLFGKVNILYGTVWNIIFSEDVPSVRIGVHFNEAL